MHRAKRREKCARLHTGDGDGTEPHEPGEPGETPPTPEVPELTNEAVNKIATRLTNDMQSPGLCSAATLTSSRDTGRYRQVGRRICLGKGRRTCPHFMISYHSRLPSTTSGKCLGRRDRKQCPRDRKEYREKTGIGFWEAQIEAGSIS